MAKLTREERETTIVFNEADDTATISTYSKRLINKMVKLGFEGEEGDLGLMDYEVPKKCIQVRKLRKGKKLTPAQKKEVRERFMAARKAAAKKGGKASKGKAEDEEDEPKKKKGKPDKVEKPKKKAVVVDDDEDEEEDEE